MNFNDLFGFNIKIDIGFLSMQKNNLKNSNYFFNVLIKVSLSFGTINFDSIASR